MLDVVLWLILAVLSLVLLVYLGELVTGRSCDTADTTGATGATGTAPPARVRLRAVLPVGAALLIVAKLGRELLDPAPGSATAVAFAVLSGVAVAFVVTGLLARAWLSCRKGPAEPDTGESRTGESRTGESRTGESQPAR